MSFEELDEKVKQSAPLMERLDDCIDRIGIMCSKGRPPKMTIPCQWDDDDIFIIATIQEVMDLIKSKA